MPLKNFTIHLMRQNILQISFFYVFSGYKIKLEINIDFFLKTKYLWIFFFIILLASYYVELVYIFLLWEFVICGEKQMVNHLSYAFQIAHRPRHTIFIYYDIVI